ncbi:MAG TPA: NAD-dependent deacylase [Armatimonadota bacterium]|nr:NAD-dependent deacylase [Armatimonadota bacterium]
MDVPAASWLADRRRSLRRIAVVTGAGISAESGLPTFRGEDALWQGRNPMELFTPEALATRTRESWELFDRLRVLSARAEPNAGHRALAALARSHGVTLATQNIDGLHQRAGSRDVLELHGTLWRLSCAGCGHAGVNETAPLPLLPPPCPACGGPLRPDVVMFGEPLPADALRAATRAAETCDLMLVVGTSGAVYPAAGLPAIARAYGALLVEINPAPTELSAQMDYAARGTAAMLLPVIVRALRGD